ncbi:hypothetical protein MMC13_000612 [Lambiella insularis]|nr:hypothetical protein [Lambiella insularis]
MATPPPPSPITAMFSTFRAELDEHHDRRERVIKASRDITALSKKIATSLPAPLPAPIATELAPRARTITALLTALLPDLHALHAWRYQRQLAPGLQELVEAAALQHYLTTQRLLAPAEARALLPAGVPLAEEDYLLGVYDLTGEIMRFAITGMARGQVPGGGARDVVGDLRGLRVGLEGLEGGEGALGREVEKKRKVMRACVEKVEGAVYGMIVRGRERPVGWVPEGGGPEERKREGVEGC